MPRRRAAQKGFPIFLPALLLLFALLASSCSLYREDKMWISERKYGVARDLYDRTGSLELTREELQALHWRRAEVNEALYRLRKQYRLE